MKKIILILLFLVAISAVYAIPQIPRQVYGSISPELPEEYPMKFKIGGVLYETGTAELNRYGYQELVLVPVDDPDTPAEKEGYVHGEDTVFVYIKDVKVAEHTYPASVNRRDIELTQDQYNEIVGAAAPVVETPAGGGGGGRRPPGCFSVWDENCTEWSPCIENGTQTRLCQDTGTCNKPAKIETRACTYIPPEITEEITEVIEEELPPEEEERKLGIWLIMFLVILGAAGIGFVFYEWEKSHKKLRTEMKGKTLEDKSLERLKSYARQTMAEGYTENQVRQALLKEGWSQQIVNQALKK